ncbi:MAG: ferrous iron transporter B [Candidatus Omnitrophota bacterium]|nr:MAG: ferrous iron transporter B [Candidatus Omnitrophota bacterium]
MSEKKILLLGNPNVGKSTIFFRLTGAKVIVSNYPGTTVEFTQGYMKVGQGKDVVIDAPGTYSLDPTCKSEEVALHMLAESDLVINIIDATNLERNLYLTLQLLEKGMPVVVVLNMRDEAKHRGIYIDVKKLEEQLGVPVISTCGLTGEGIKELIECIPQAKAVKVSFSNDSERWKKIGNIVEGVQNLSHHHHTLLERLEDLSIRPLTGIPIALGVVYCCFWIVRFLGENIIGYIFEPLFTKLWLPLMLKINALMREGSFLSRILIGNLIEGEINFGQSFGLLTTGLYVPIAMVLPYIFSFYLILGFLEDFGYLPRLAVLLDNVMHHFGLHGYAIIPFILGLGCNVPGALAIRLLEGRREKFIAATLMAVAIPCMAQIAMIIGILGSYGGKYVVIVFSTLFVLLVIKGVVLNKVLKGMSPEILIEIPPYRIPQFTAVVKKLWMRVLSFLKEALPFVLLGILLVNILYSLKIVDFIASAFTPALTELWGLPKEAIPVLIVGFLRKDVAVGMLAPLDLTVKQLVIGSTILAIYFPCVATFSVLVRELGLKDMLKSALIMLTIALAVGCFLNLIL